MKFFYLPLFTFLSIAFVSCEKGPQLNPDQETERSNKIAPDGFNFETSRKVDIDIHVLSNIDEPLRGIIVEVNTTSGETLFKAATDEAGLITGSVNIPSYVDTLVVNPGNPGLIQNIKILIVNNILRCTIGGENGVIGPVITTSNRTSKIKPGHLTFAPTGYSYLGSHDINGRPINYLDPVKGAVTSDLLSYLAESLPDKQNVGDHHPQYLTDDATKHLKITKTSDVWVTFVSEGAGYSNSIGYYTYPTNNPPNNPNKIDEVKFIFPNASGIGSGGNMQSGDRVKIGKFNAGISIGFVLIQNGWSQSLNTVNNSQLKFYSDSKFNPESSASLRTHSVLLNYTKENLFVLGFEDLRRDNNTSDHDFNDVVLYATSTPADGISTAGVQGIVPPKDSDNDGVWDVNDQFPLDADKAYITYFPSQNTKATLAFEDNWPSKGDYDMNDLVVNYRYSFVSNAANKVVEMTGTFSAVAAWTTNESGFGIQFPFAPELISDVSGQKLTGNYIIQNPNGTEAGQQKAVVIPFDNQADLIINQTKIIDSAVVKISFAQPVDFATLGNIPFNPFLISKKERGLEAHLPGGLPTDKANKQLFGTENDRTNPASNKYYLSEDNWPWAISFTEPFQYPKEGYPINTAYLHFAEWASSGGTIFTDWYKNTGTGYRDRLKIH